MSEMSIDNYPKASSAYQVSRNQSERSCGKMSKRAKLSLTPYEFHTKPELSYFFNPLKNQPPASSKGANFSPHC